ncbi:FadR/GntR family transcriptional regulator (plasmid) [Shimia sp. W99]
MSERIQIQSDPTRQLRDFLFEQAFQPGDKLPPERDLANSLGLTRARLRTALARLEKEGLIWRHVGQGTFMSTLSAARDPAGQFLSEIDTNPSEILEARLAVEPQIASLAAVRASGQDIENIRQRLTAQEAESSWTEWGKLDHDFHLAVARAARNALLETALITIQKSQTQRNWGHLSNSESARARRSDVMREHWAILHAIEARDVPGAQAAMRRHLESVRGALLGPFS